MESTLNSKGLRRDTANPDLWVVPHTRLSKETQINTYNSGWGYGWGWGYAAGMGPGMSTSTVSDNPVGPSHIDGDYAGKKQMLWRATAGNTRYHGSSPETK